MSVMHLQATSDISLVALEHLADGLPAEWNAEVDAGQYHLKGAFDAPSWIAILADWPWWKQTLGAGAGLYFGGIIGAAGKETWRNRGQIAAKVRAGAGALRRFVDFLEAATATGSAGTFVILSVPLSEHHEVRLHLPPGTREEREFAVALFVHQLKAIAALVEREGLSRKVSGHVIVDFRHEDCSMLVSWLSADARMHEVLLPLANNG